MSEQERAGSFADMTQAWFLMRLRTGMLSLPTERIREIEEDIRRHFDEGKANGEDEASLCSMLGDPDVLAREYVSLYQQEVSAMSGDRQVFYDGFSYGPRRRSPVLKGLLAFGMLLFGLAIALPVWVVLWAGWIVLACGYIIAPAGLLAILAAILGVFTPLPQSMAEYPLINLFGGVACIALGGLMAMGARFYAAKLLFWTRSYLEWHRRVITGDRD